MTKHIVDTRQLKNRALLEGLFDSAGMMKKTVASGQPTWRHEGKIVGSFFYQPSTRTKMTFDAAAKRLGADVVGTENAREFSSAFKGETLEHSLLAVQECFDLIVMRHHENGSAKRAAGILNIPFVNAGDGSNQHPTQALLDLFTIRERFGRIDNLQVTFVGDIIYGRTIKSLTYLLSYLKDNSFHFISPKSLSLPQDLKEHLIEHNIEFKESHDLDGNVSGADVLYVTRMQFEYVKDEKQKNLFMEDYKKFQINRAVADSMKEGSIIMHPLPINTDKSNGWPEIAPEVDSHPKAYYFRQSNNGLYVRMALLDMLLDGAKNPLYNMILDVP